MWTDNETKIDLIGFKVHADLIQNVVTDEKVLPTVLGVFGDWGGGKSSIMQMLKHELETDVRYKDDVICLYFNGWMSTFLQMRQVLSTTKPPASLFINSTKNCSKLPKLLKMLKPLSRKRWTNPALSIQ